jgi:hypothetical protein
MGDLLTRWQTFKTALSTQWPTLTSASVSIGFYSWAINSLLQLPADQADWGSLIISSITPIIIYISFGTLFLTVAGFLFITTYDTIRLYSLFTIAFITMALTLSIVAIAINNHTNDTYDNKDAFSAAVNPILMYVFMGCLSTIAVSCMFFITYANPMPAMGFSILVSMISIILSTIATGLTRISRQ